MKNTQKGFILPLLLVLAALLLVASGAYVYMQKKTVNENTDSSQATSTAQTTSTDQYAGWNTYTNTLYGYSIKYPKDWIIGTDHSNDGFTSRGDAPYDYIGGDTVISNYSGEINSPDEIPPGYLAVTWMFWKLPNSKIATTTEYTENDYTDVRSVKKEEININDIHGIKTTLLGLSGIGSGAEPNSTGVTLKINDGEAMAINYGFDENNAASAKIADQIINSLTFSNLSETLNPEITDWNTYVNKTYGFSFQYSRDVIPSPLEKGNDNSLSLVANMDLENGGGHWIYGIGVGKKVGNYTLDEIASSSASATIKELQEEKTVVFNDVTVGGKPAVRYSIKNYGDYGNAEVFIDIGNNNILSISGDDSDSVDKAELDTMLSTFKFTN